ncbi:MAG TPA: thioredoxin domain-containing protein [Solirubrobacterales bacterium]|nr:thioredoxin domain-containing protein [Solirubrobacterales bacterium]
MATRQAQKERLREQRLAQEAEAQAKERRRRLVQYGSAAAFLAVCAVAVLVIISQSGGGSSGSGTEDAALVKQQLRGIPQHGTVLGDPNAKVTVIEYADLQCPVCQAFSTETAPDLISQVVRKNTATYDLRQYTIIGPDSAVAAKAALAAGEQDRYWNFVELFYRNQGTENSGYVTDDFLTSVAKGAGVPDLDKWNQDRQSPKWDAALSKVQSETQSLGINSTPTFVVQGPGGKKVVGSGILPLSQLQIAIKSVE